MTSQRIALIIPYFGKLPDYFPYFVESARHSPDLHVLLFTDAVLGVPLPSNIAVYPSTLSDFQRLATRTLGVEVCVPSPYKLCDFRPAFGRIFQEYIGSHEFWAFGDIDLLYGNLQQFLAPVLPMNDITSFRRHWISGSLCVLRNCRQVNLAYTYSHDWQKAFTSPEYQHFDEMGGHFYAEAHKGADVLSWHGKVDSFTHAVLRLARSGSLRCAFTDLACENLDWGETLVYDNGQLMRMSDESPVMYVHYVLMKRRFFEVPRTGAPPSRFYIRRTGIYTDKPSPRTVCMQEGARVLRGASNGLRRLVGRCWKSIGYCT